MTSDDAGGRPPLETYVFDGRRSRAGLPLNNLSIALNDPDERRRFLENPEEMMERFKLSEEQKRAVRDKDFLAMIELGGNIYFNYKIGAVHGMSVPEIVARMSGQTPEEFRQMMKDGGRKPHG